jgi:hypothetical protein
MLLMLCSVPSHLDCLSPHQLQPHQEPLVLKVTMPTSKKSQLVKLAREMPPPWGDGGEGMGKVLHRRFAEFKVSQPLRGIRLGMGVV